MMNLAKVQLIRAVLLASAIGSSHARDGWYGWGGGPRNDRQAVGSLVDSGNIGKLVQTCEKSYDVGPSAAPLVDGGIAYYTTWAGSLVALDYRQCEVVWETNVTAAVLKFAAVTELQRLSGIKAVSRSSPVTDGTALFIGTLAHALVMAIDKSSGDIISTLQVDPHPVGIVTQSPTFFEGLLLVGTSSLEVTSATIPGYDCCSHVGSMNAVVLRDGQLELAWTHLTIEQPRNVTGPLFSGASIWGSQPVGDAARRQVIVATGNTHSVPREFEECQAATRDLHVVRQGLVPDPCLPRDALQESVVAFDLATGRVNWARQLGPLDAWNVACVVAPAPGSDTTNCPAYPGLDADFGMAPAFVPGSAHTPHGLDVVVVGQKNGNLYCLSAATGTVLWAVVTGPAGLEGGLSWGVAVDAEAVYYTLINTARQPHLDADGHPIHNSAFGAVRLRDGATLWKVAVPRDRQSIVAPSVANDLVLTGSTGTINAEGWIDGPGTFIALNKHTGQVVRETDLADYFKGNVAVVKDRVFFGTGYQGGLQPPFPGSFQVWQVDGQTP